MAWTSPKTWVTREQLTSADFNTYIRDNQQHLYDNLFTDTILQYSGTDAGFSTTSTSYQDTGLSVSVVVSVTSTVICWVASTIETNNASYYAQASIHKDATPTGSGGLTYMTNNVPMICLSVDTGVTAATYTYTLKLKSENASATVAVSSQQMFVLVIPE